MKYHSFLIILILIVVYLSGCVSIHELSPKQSTAPETSITDSLSAANNKDKEMGSAVFLSIFLLLVIASIQTGD